MPAIDGLTNVWRAGGSLAEVPGMYQNANTLLLKQASHRRILRVLGSRGVACAPALACFCALYC